MTYTIFIKDAYPHKVHALWEKDEYWAVSINNATIAKCSTRDEANNFVIALNKFCNDIEGL